MQREQRPRILLSDAGPEAFEPMARVVLGKLGYLILLPKEMRALSATTRVDPDFRIVEAEHEDEISDCGSDVPIFVAGSNGSERDDPRVVGRLERPIAVDALFQAIQGLTESTPRSVPRVPTALAAQCRCAGRRWEVQIHSLSEGGCLLQGETALTVGSPLALDFDLPGAGPVVVAGEVSYAYQRHAGVAFRHLSEATAKHIGAYVAQALLD